MYGSGSTTTIKNSILAGNSNGSGPNNVVKLNATLTSQGYNLESGTDAGFTSTGDLQNSNPLLIALANNGGPTKTHALEDGSPALEQIPSGTNGCGTTYTTDQRGETRPGSKNQPTNKCEIGAWEAQTVDPTAITLSSFGAQDSGTPLMAGMALLGLLVVGGVAAVRRKRA